MAYISYKTFFIAFSNIHTNITHANAVKDQNSLQVFKTIILLIPVFIVCSEVIADSRQQ